MAWAARLSSARVGNSRKAGADAAFGLAAVPELGDCVAPASGWDVEAGSAARASNAFASAPTHQQPS